MTAAYKYTYPWPLEGYETAEPLSEILADDKSMINPKTNISAESYKSFTHPLNNGRRGGFDVHVYYDINDAEELAYAKALYDRVRREFPELRTYKFWDKPVGPHVLTMFEVDLLSPVEFGAFVPWMAIWRGPLSVLVHPNTTTEEEDEHEEERNHTQRAIWMGEKMPLKTKVFAEVRRKKKAEEAEKQAKENGQ